MKRHNHLFEKILAFDNLLLATKKAQKGKRNNQSTAAFHFRLEENILTLKSELQTQIHHVKDGISFLGFTVFPFYKFVQKSKQKRYRRNLRRQLKLRADRKNQPQGLEDGLNAWLGHIRFGCSRRLENNVFKYLCSHGVNLHKHPSDSWRVLEQQQ